MQAPYYGTVNQTGSLKTGLALRTARPVNRLTVNIPTGDLPATSGGGAVIYPPPPISTPLSSNGNGGGGGRQRHRQTRNRRADVVFTDVTGR